MKQWQVYVADHDGIYDFFGEYSSRRRGEFALYRLFSAGYKAYLENIKTGELIRPFASTITRIQKEYRKEKALATCNSRQT